MKAELENDFEAFVASSWDRFFRTAYAITRDHEHAEDALRAALGATYTHWRRVSRSGQPETFVRRRLVNEILGWGPRRRSTPLRPQDEVPMRRPGDRHLVDTDTVWTAMRDLPVGQRTVIVLRYYERLSVDEVASTLATRPEVVSAQTAAALADLRRLLTIARQRARA